MDTYIITRSCYTGVNEYRYFREYRQIGRAQAFVLPGFPVAVSWGEQVFTCRREQNPPQDPDSLSLFDSRTKQRFASVSRTGPVQKGSPFSFAHPEMEWQDQELYMAMMTTENLSDEQAVLILRFPLLRPNP